MTWKRSFLVVANVTATSDRLIEALGQRAAHEPASFTLVIPATPFGGGRAAAVQKLEEALEQMRAIGLEAQGSFEVDARGPAGTDRQADRCAGDARGLAAAPARARGGATAGAPRRRDGAAVRALVGRS
jgi:hypothetical protein